jgi:hypothetical protein
VTAQDDAEFVLARMRESTVAATDGKAAEAERLAVLAEQRVAAETVAVKRMKAKLESRVKEVSGLAVALSGDRVCDTRTHAHTRIPLNHPRSRSLYFVFVADEGCRRCG